MGKNHKLWLAVAIALFCSCGAFGQTVIPQSWRLETPQQERIKNVNEILHNGQPALRFELNKKDEAVSNGKRSEIATPPEISPNVERYYSFSIFLPNDFETDTIPEIVAQWHAQPDFSSGETWRSPPIALSTRNGHWRLTIRWATDSVNTNKTVSGIKSVDLGAYEKNKWIDWQFHIKFSCKDDGLIEVWKNKASVFTRKGPNYYNDKKGPFFKFGIYKWAWMNKNLSSAITRRVLYFSDVNIADSMSRK